MADKRFAVLGCAHDTQVWHAVLTQALEGADAPTLVRLPDGDSVLLKHVMRSMRKGDLAGAITLGPLSSEVLDLVDETDANARRAGAANVVVVSDRKLCAYNTQVSGLADSVSALGLASISAVVIGAGHSAMCAVAACRSLGVQMVACTSRSWTTTESLHESPRAAQVRSAGALTALWPAGAATTKSSRFSNVMRLQFHDLAASADLLFHATSAFGKARSSKRTEVMDAIPWSRLKPTVVVCDLEYRTGTTPVSKEAQGRGLTSMAGSEIVARQVARAVEVWSGLRPAHAPLQMAAERATAEQSR